MHLGLSSVHAGSKPTCRHRAEQGAICSSKLQRDILQERFAFVVEAAERGVQVFFYWPAGTGVHCTILPSNSTRVAAPFTQGISALEPHRDSPSPAPLQCRQHREACSCTPGLPSRSIPGTNSTRLSETVSKLESGRFSSSSSPATRSGATSGSSPFLR